MMFHPAIEIERDGAVYRVEARPLLPTTFHGGIQENRLARTSADVRTIVPTMQSWGIALLFFLAAASATRLALGLLQVGNGAWVAVIVIVIGVAVTIVARVAGLLILTDRTRFDRVAGRAVRGKLGQTVWSVDLREVVA